jgi:CubicO group peptidase (beta-lactamase class C family)
VTTETALPKASDIDSIWREHAVPGVAVGLIADGEEWIQGFGVTNVDHPLPVDGDTLFQIGSITKTFTATALMRLVERGAVSLDTPVRTYLPDLRLADEDVARRVTLRHLLTHHGGWFGDYFKDTGANDDALARYVAKLATLEQMTPLGEIWSYSNSGFALAARVMEVVTGGTAEDAVTDLVLKPLGMTHSFFFARDAITHRVAAGHFVYEDATRVARPWFIPRNAHAIGGLVSSARDMLKYARFHQGDGRAPDGTQLLSIETLRAMRTPQAKGALDLHAGIGWSLRQIGDATMASHTGGTIGQQALLALIPSRSFALVVLTNSGQGALVHQAILGWSLAARLGTVLPEPKHESRTSDELAGYAGVYESPGNRVEVRVDDGALVLRSETKVALAEEFERKPPPLPPARATFCGTDRIVVLDGPTRNTQGEFLRDGSLIRWLRIGGRIHRRMDNSVSR